MRTNSAKCEYMYEYCTVLVRQGKYLDTWGTPLRLQARSTKVVTDGSNGQQGIVLVAMHRNVQRDTKGIIERICRPTRDRARRYAQGITNAVMNLRP